MLPACHISSWVVTLKRKGKESEGLSAARTTAAAYIRNAYTSRAAQRILINRAAAAGLYCTDSLFVLGTLCIRFVMHVRNCVGFGFMCGKSYLRFVLLNYNDLSGKPCPEV